MKKFLNIAITAIIISCLCSCGNSTDTSAEPVAEPHAIEPEVVEQVVEIEEEEAPEVYIDKSVLVEANTMWNVWEMVRNYSLTREGLVSYYTQDFSYVKEEGVYEGLYKSDFGYFSGEEVGKLVYVSEEDLYNPFDGGLLDATFADEVDGTVESTEDCITYVTYEIDDAISFANAYTEDKNEQLSKVMYIRTFEPTTLLITSFHAVYTYKNGDTVEDGYSYTYDVDIPEEVTKLLEDAENDELTRKCRIVINPGTEEETSCEIKTFKGAKCYGDLTYENMFIEYYTDTECTELYDADTADTEEDITLYCKTEKGEDDG